jgi:hypothetical protein
MHDHTAALGAVSDFLSNAFKGVRERLLPPVFLVLPSPVYMVGG